MTSDELARAIVDGERWYGGWRPGGLAIDAQDPRDALAMVGDFDPGLLVAVAAHSLDRGVPADAHKALLARASDVRTQARANCVRSSATRSRVLARRAG